MRKSVLRALRWFSFSMCLAVLLAVLFFFSTRETNFRKPPASHAELLQKEVTSAIRQIEYVEMKNGKPSLRVRAGKNISTSGGLNQLQQVTVTYYRDKNGEDTIAADECYYAMDQNQIRFNGNVRVQTYEGYAFQTSHVSYDKSDERIKGNNPISFALKGGRGSANGFDLSLKSKELHLHGKTFMEYQPETGAVPFVVQEEGTITFETEDAWLHEEARTVVMKNGVLLKSDLSRLTGQEMELVITDQNLLKNVVCSGNARLERVDPKATLTLAGQRINFLFKEGNRYTLDRVVVEDNAKLIVGDVSLQAPTINILTSATGEIDSVIAKGGIKFTSTANGQEITGSEIMAFFTSQHNFKRLEIKGNAKISQRESNKQSELAADIIVLETRPATAEHMTVLEKLSANGNCTVSFVSGKGDSLECRFQNLDTRYDQTGRFPERAMGDNGCYCRYRMPSTREEVEVWSRRLVLEFFPDSADPSKFKGDGDVRMRRTVSGQTPSESISKEAWGTFSAADHRKINSLIQTGNFHYQDSQIQSSAERAEFTDGTIHLTGHPQAQIQDTIIRASEFWYDQKTEVVTAQGGVETVRSAQGKSSGVIPQSIGSPEAKQPIYLHSASVRLEQKTDRVFFTGGCRMNQGKNNLTAASFIFNRQDETFSAEGNVFALLFVHDAKKAERQLELRAGKLHYSTKTKKISLEQQVETRSIDYRLSSDQLVGVFSENGDLLWLDCLGHIRIEKDERLATGDTAHYELAKGEITLCGNPAQVVDRKEGRTQGAQLTFTQGDDRVRIDNGNQLPLKDGK